MLARACFKKSGAQGMGKPQPSAYDREKKRYEGSDNCKSFMKIKRRETGTVWSSCYKSEEFSKERRGIP